ncbi:MAG: FAD-dependent oxidoreductase [Planctomycetes bacterium]|nr:FAD-dependent oxidoreductase [Planctomycetota bacterium]
MSKIAIIGTGIAGNTAAYHLNKHHDITVFEADSRPGGHANTVAIESQGKGIFVDTGFIVYNELTYPGLVDLFKELGVETTSTEMGFAISDKATGLEYSTQSLSGLLGGKGLYRADYWVMWRDFLKFRKRAFVLLAEPQGKENLTLGDFLEEGNYSKLFKRDFILPLGGAIWSTSLNEMQKYPALTYLSFLKNHQMLNMLDHAEWRTVKHGSQQYVSKLINPWRDKLRLSSPVEVVKKTALGIIVKAKGQQAELFDEVVMAVHSPQALAMIENPSHHEKRVLGALKYQKNLATLHKDSQYLPERISARACWNVHLDKEDRDSIAVTYWMNKLQGLDTSEDICVTLNSPEPIEDKHIFAQFQYDHPFFDKGAIVAQGEWGSISGIDGIHFCGAGWRWGFHEDGHWSAMRVINQIESWHRRKYA